VTPPPTLSRRFWLRITLVLVLGVALLALGTRAFAALRARLVLPTGSAQWIWVARDRTDRSPTAFYAVRDFDLDSPPDRARLLAVADPEYVLSLNGKRIGAGQYQAGAGEPVAKLDVYEVGDLLQPGGNRLVAELRSDRGAGGFLAVLQDDRGHILVRTDGEWRIVKRHHFGLLRGWLPLGPPLGSRYGLESEPAFSWGLPPTGRWGRPVAGPVKPRLLELLQDRPAAAAQTVAPRIPALPAGAARHMVLFDWGREVAGYLTFQMPAGEGLKTALLFVGNHPPDPLQETPNGAVLAMTGRRSWMDARARRFRYVLVIGDRPLAARVLPVDPKQAAGLFDETSRQQALGVFGIEPPPLRTPVQDEIWRKLQRVSSVGGRKDR